MRTSWAPVLPTCHLDAWFECHMVGHLGWLASDALINWCENILDELGIDLNQDRGRKEDQ